MSRSTEGDHPKLAAFVGSRNATKAPVQNSTGKKTIRVPQKWKSEVSLATGECCEKEVVVALLSLVFGK